MNHLDQLRQDLRIDAVLQGQKLTFATTWGLFSPKTIDEGTQLLIDQLDDIAPDADCLDLGCGYGPLGLTLARLAPRGTTHLVDKDFVAIDYTIKNAALNGLANTRAYLSNGFDQVPADAKFDIIVSNIPAKINGELLELFLHDAKARLKPGGRLYVVTIAGLKDYMKRNFKEIFGNYDKLKQSAHYAVAVAVAVKEK